MNYIQEHNLSLSPPSASLITRREADIVFSCGLS